MVSMIMLKKIISDGQTGADQAALDAAIKWQIPHGGWIPKGRKTERGPLPNKYQLKELPADHYPKYNDQNVLDSDGTLILSHGKLTGGSAYTSQMAEKHGRPRLHLDLNKVNKFNAAQAIRRWTKRHDIGILNVAGPRSSKAPYIYQAVMKILVTVFHLDFIESTMPDPAHTASPHPGTIDQAVDALIAELPLRNKTEIANMGDEDLIYLQLTLGAYIRDKFGPLDENSELLRDCCVFMEVDTLDADNVPAIIITRLWRRLKETHSLRVVK